MDIFYNELISCLNHRRCILYIYLIFIFQTKYSTFSFHRSKVFNSRTASFKEVQIGGAMELPKHLGHCFSFVLYIFQLLYIAQCILKVSQTQVFLSFSNLKICEFQLAEFPSHNFQTLKYSVF